MPVSIFCIYIETVFKFTIKRDFLGKTKAIFEHETNHFVLYIFSIQITSCKILWEVLPTRRHVNQGKRKR